MDFLKLDEEIYKETGVREALQRKALFAGGIVVALTLLLLAGNFVAKIWSSGTVKASDIPSSTLQTLDENTVDGYFAGSTSDIGAEQDLYLGPELPSGEMDYIFKEDDTLTSVLASFGMDADDFAVWASRVEKRCNLDRIRIGDRMKLAVTDGRLSYVEIACSEFEWMVLRPNDPVGPYLEFKEIPYAEVERVYEGKVESSFYKDAIATGLTDTQVMVIAKAFASDIDFDNDLKLGDSFKILVMEKQNNGKRLGAGKLMAAVLNLNEKKYWAIAYSGSDGKGFFDLKGRSLKKSLLRTPIKFSRVSSGFSYRRYHPILGRSRPHLAVDYAASTGTPIVASADGAITFKGKKGGYGNYIRIKHTSELATSYAHLSRFAKGIQRGGRVKQGQVIGYVGKTGLATGPHLHYTMYKKGRPVDPLKEKAMTPLNVYGARWKEIKQKAISALGD